MGNKGIGKAGAGTPAFVVSVLIFLLFCLLLSVLILPAPMSPFGCLISSSVSHLFHPARISIRTSIIFPYIRGLRSTTGPFSHVT